MLFERKVQIQHSAVKNTLETVSLWHFPLSIDNFECNVFIRRPSWESDYESVWSIWLLQIILRCLSFVNEIRIKDVELVSLDCLWRRVIYVIMGLVILIPFIASLNCVKKTRFPRLIPIFPFVFVNRHLLIATTIQDVCKLFFILTNSFPLHFFIHVERWIIKAHLVYIKSNKGVKCSLFNFFYCS
jgi:hypothetical protein